MNQVDTSRDSELQNLLKDERDRCNQHKQMYQTLKEKYSNLQEELKSIYDQLKSAVAENESMRSSHESYIHKLENRIKEKENEIEVLRDKLSSYDPRKIRESVLEEATQHYESKFKELNTEMDSFRERYNTLHYEHAVMKCQLESRESEYLRSVERIKLQHLNEIEQLQNKVEALTKEKSFPADNFALELKAAKREILQLEGKSKVIMAECEELRAQNESLSLQINSGNRTHAKQLADNMTTIRALESEKLKLSMQKEVLEKEFVSSQEHRKLINKELQAYKRENFVLQGKLMENEHKNELSITNLQVEMERKKAEQEAEKELLSEEIANVKSELHNVTEELNKTQQILVLKEQEYHQSALTARQHLWKQTNELNKEKEKLEKRLLEIENTRDEHLELLCQELKNVKQNLQLCNEAKLNLEKEIFNLKKQQQETSKCGDSQAYETLLKEHSKCQKDFQDMKEKIASLSASRNEILEEKEQYLRDKIAKNNSEPNQDCEVLRLKLGWEQQKHQFYQKIEELESQLKESRQSATTEKQQLEHKLKKYSYSINKLKEKLQTVTSQNENLEIQREELRKNVPMEIYLQVKNQLDILQKRVEEYRHIVSIEPGFQVGRISAPSSTEKLLADIKNLQIPTNLVKIHQTDSTRFTKENIEKNLVSDKGVYSRRRSVKTRNRDRLAAKLISPIISSSSDTEQENL